VKHFARLGLERVAAEMLLFLLDFVVAEGAGSESGRSVNREQGLNVSYRLGDRCTACEQRSFFAGVQVTAVTLENQRRQPVLTVWRAESGTRVPAGAGGVAAIVSAGNVAGHVGLEDEFLV
jgi:hypothetical protein